MTSAYKIRSNRRNARKSCGPKTAAGKERVRLNALTHGLSAKTAVLPDEDPAEYGRKRDALWDVLNPQNDVEVEFADTFVLAAWRRKRCVSAEVGMTACKRRDAESDKANEENHAVLNLGRRLFSDRCGDSRLYPHASKSDSDYPRTSYPAFPNDPNDPGHILLDLERTVTGCRWLLGCWAELKDKLSPGLCWDSRDKLKAVRLLGKQPLDAPDDPVVCLIFLASYMIDPRLHGPFAELDCEFHSKGTEIKDFKLRLRERPWKAMRPKDAAEARQKLAEVMDRATARLEGIIARHEKHAAHYAEKAAHAQGFDASKEAECVRRHERACVRDMFRSYDTLTKLRERKARDLAEPDHGHAPASEADQHGGPEWEADQREARAWEAFRRGGPRWEDYLPGGPADQPDAPACPELAKGARDEYQPDAPACPEPVEGACPELAEEARDEYQPDAPARDEYQPDASAYQADAPAREAQCDLPASEVPASADGLSDGSRATDEGQPATDNQSPDGGLEPIFQNKAKIKCDGDAGSPGQRDENAGPGMVTSDHTEEPGSSFSEGQPAAPSEPALSSPSPPLPELPSADPWIDFSSRRRMLKAEAVRSRRREQDEARRKHCREENRRFQAELREKRRRRADEKRQRDAAKLAATGPPMSAGSAEDGKPHPTAT